MGTFFPHHYITYGNRHALVRISENGSIMISMAMVDFFIVNKAKLQLKQQDIINHTKELSSHIITLPMETDTLWSRFLKNGSIMKSMAMVDFFIENKGTFFPHPYITYGNRHSLELSSHIITLPMETDTLWSHHQKWVDNEIHDYGRLCSLKIKTRFGPYLENGSIMKSMAMVDFFIENKGTFFPYHYITNGNRHALVRISKNGSLMKSMTMVDFFIENKGTFFPYHYITYGNRHALVRICENRSIMKSMAMVDFFIENKGTFFPYLYITYENRQLWSQICKNGSIMKSMAMVDFFIENKENGSIMKSLAMVDFFIENKGKLQLKQQDIINHTKVGKGVNFCANRNFLPTSLHYLWKQTLFGPLKAKKWVDNEIHGYGQLLH
ncbi:hypothetical protein H6P81_021662 [Aristolochia fimbriata]|uniref:Uncharacterized protein n=1 Tax=Aristolochia fimbriata TaxID=158543 RepID=A0AAV7DTV4_ARIFI|nr:hypothetical protein H6P81_021662 [Aristolochia fimbriata]